MHGIFITWHHLEIAVHAVTVASVLPQYDISCKLVLTLHECIASDLEMTEGGQFRNLHGIAWYMNTPWQKHGKLYDTLFIPNQHCMVLAPVYVHILVYSCIFDVHVNYMYTMNLTIVVMI